MAASDETIASIRGWSTLLLFTEESVTLLIYSLLTITEKYTSMMRTSKKRPVSDPLLCGTYNMHSRVYQTSIDYAPKYNHQPFSSCIWSYHHINPRPSPRCLSPIPVVFPIPLCRAPPSGPGEEEDRWVVEGEEGDRECGLEDYLPHTNILPADCLPLFKYSVEFFLLRCCSSFHNLLLNICSLS